MWSSPSQAAKSTKLKTHGIDLKQMGFFGNLKRHPARCWNLHFSHTFWTHPGVMVKCVGGNICNLKMFGWKFGIWKTMQFLFSIELMCHLLSKNYIWMYSISVEPKVGSIRHTKNPSEKNSQTFRTKCWSTNNFTWSSQQSFESKNALSTGCVNWISGASTPYGWGKPCVTCQRLNFSG